MFYRFLLLIFALLFLTSCLDTNFEDPNTAFSLFAELDENNDFFELGGNSVRVLSVRFFVNEIEIEAVGESEFFETDPRYVNLNNFSLSNQVTVGSGELFGGSYTGISFNLKLPPLSTSVNDDILIERNSNGDIVKVNSAVINGIFNGEGFNIIFDSTERVSFSFDRTIEMPEKNGTLQVNLLANWREWFLNDSREELLDPSINSERELIKENFKKIFTAQTFTVGEF